MKNSVYSKVVIYGLFAMLCMVQSIPVEAVEVEVSATTTPVEVEVSTTPTSTATSSTVIHNITDMDAPIVWEVQPENAAMYLLKCGEKIFLKVKKQPC